MTTLCPRQKHDTSPIRRSEPASGENVTLAAATIPQLGVLFDLMEQLEDTLMGVASQERAEGLPSGYAEDLLGHFNEQRTALVEELRRRRPVGRMESEHRACVLLRHAMNVGESVHGVLQVALECASERH